MAEIIDISDDDIICDEPPIKKSKKKIFKCLNPDCRKENDLVKATNSMRRFYGVLTYEKKTRICFKCSAYYKVHTDNLIQSVKAKNLLLSNPISFCKNTVVLSDSDSDLTDFDSNSEDTEYEYDSEELFSQGEDFTEAKEPRQRIQGLIGKMSQELGLKQQINDGVKSLNSRLLASEEGFAALNADFKKIENSIDSIRNNFYEVFRQDIKWLPPIEIGSPPPLPKRSRQSTSLPPPPDGAEVIAESFTNHGINLPPLGPLERPELKENDKVFYPKCSIFSRWVPASVLGIEKRETNFTLYQIRALRSDPLFNLNANNGCRKISGRNLAYFDPCSTRIQVGTRVIAKYIDDDQRPNALGHFYVGIVAEIPTVANKYRYLIFFDDGYAQYKSHNDIRVVVECSPAAYDDVASDSREFIKDYLETYPERPMVRLQKYHYIKTELSGRWWKAQVLEVDGSLVKMHFPLQGRTEWIYRGSTRLSPLFNKKMAIQAQAEQSKVIRRRTLPYNRSGPVVEYVNFDQEKESQKQKNQTPSEGIPTERRAVARKSTSGRAGTPPLEVQEQVFQESRGFSRRKAISCLNYIFQPHQCSSKCFKSEEAVMKMNCSPLLKPILASWRRQICKQRKKTLTKILISYIAPCGRRLRSIEEVFLYLRLTQSQLEIDFFSFSTGVDPLNEWEPAKKNLFIEDISDGVEKISISCANSLDKNPPKDMVYCDVRQPIENVNLNLDPDFLVCCSCEDDCQDKSRCECWLLTLEAMKVIGHPDTDDIGYRYRRLHEQVPTGIYECNSKCSCKNSCLNRVVQYPLRLKLQLFKTARRGWGVRTLNDIPQGGFICVYVGKVLSEAVANEEGKMSVGGDDYYAELDFIEVVEEIKEGYESDVEDSHSDEENEPHTRKTHSKSSNGSKYDVDKDYVGSFEPGISRAKRSGAGVVQTSTKDLSDEDYEEEENDQQERRPQTFEPMNLPKLSPNAKTGIAKSARQMFGENEAVFIMDAKHTGNIGRYFNHSCQPNIFVQNAFVDTHDLRFPWVAFFASTNIRAGTELTWDYNYEVGSVQGKVKYCYCGAKKCRGRLL